MTKSIFPCSRCGSKNTVLKSSMPTKNGLKDLLNDLMDSFRSSLPNGKNGQKFVVCRDCGHVSVVMVN